MDTTQTATKYQTYPKYKPSGIDWLGDIPTGWEMKKYRHVFSSIKNGTTSNQIDSGESEFPVTRIETISDGIINFEKVGYLNNADALADYRVTLGDILLSHINSLEMVGKCAAMIENRLLINGMNLLHLKVARNYSWKYILYFLKSTIGINQMRAVCKHAINQVSVSTVNFKALAVPVPSIAEQHLIIDFLDRETAKIDEVVGKKQKLIELLKEKRQALITHAVTKGLDPRAKLKPSGINWLGDIPYGWEVRRLKYISNTRVSNVDKKSEDHIAVRLCNYIDVYKNEFIDEKIDFMGATATVGQVEKFELKQGDVIITKDSETPDDIGVPSYVTLENTKNIVCGYHLSISTPNEAALLGKYLFRLFQSRLFRSYFEISCNGVTRFGLDTYSVFNADIILPTISEQHAIIDFLDLETTKIDEVMEKIESQIEKLQEYRQALITSTVTGKIMVN